MPDNKRARPYPKIQPRCLRIILFSALFSQPEGFYQCRKMLSTITSTTPTAHAMVEVMDQMVS